VREHEFAVSPVATWAPVFRMDNLCDVSVFQDVEHRGLSGHS